jgi:hypothetical protein
MKNVWLHGLFLSIIGILAFQLYSTIKARDLAFGQVAQVLENNCKILDSDSRSLCDEIEKESARNFVLYEQYRDCERALVDQSKEVNNNVSNYLSEAKAGKKLNKIAIRDDLKSFFISASVLVRDPKDRAIVISKSSLNKLIENDTFWKGFNENPTTNLLMLKSQIKLDDIMYLNYLLDKVSSRGTFCGITKYLIAVFPKKSALIEGDKFEADISLVSYSSLAQGLTFTVNNQVLPIKDGVAHFSKIENSTGLKTIHTQATVRNPATGETLTVNNEFQYHVLPKCSQNCQ